MPKFSVKVKVKVKVMEELNLIDTTLKKIFKDKDHLQIVDIGSLNALEAIHFSKNFPNSQIFSFEPHPDSYANCLKNTKDIKNIKVINKAIFSSSKVVKFFPIDKEKTTTNNPEGVLGASSMLLANTDYPYEKYVQNEIEVEAIRIDDFCIQNKIEKIDFAWIDVQGVGLSVLKSFGIFLDRLKVIHIEGENFEIYKNQEMFSEIHSYLIKKKFKLIYGNKQTNYLDNFIYVKNEYYYKFFYKVILNKINFLKYRIKYNLIPRVRNKLKKF